MVSDLQDFQTLVPMAPEAMATPCFQPGQRLAPLARATIFVRDLDVSLRLYRDLLGLTVMFDNLWRGERINTILGRRDVRLRAVVLMAGSSTQGNLGIYQILDDEDGDAVAAPPAGGVRIGDFALVFPTSAIVDLSTEIEAAGYPIVSPIIHLVEREEYLVQPAEMMFRDADGILVNLVQSSVRNKRPGRHGTDRMTGDGAAAARPMDHKDRLPLGVCIGYGVGSVGAVMMANVVATFFPAFMATVLGQSTITAGLLLTGSKLYDAVADVMLGRASDRSASRWGRRRPFMLAGSVVAAASIAMIFSPTVPAGAALIGYLILALLLYSTGYSMFAVPYTAMSGEMTGDYRERTRLQSFRVFFMAAGQIASVAGAAAIVAWAGGGRHGYALMGFAVAAIIFVTMLACVLGTARARRTPREHDGEGAPLLTTLRSVLSNRPLAYLLVAKLFQYLSVSIFFSVLLLFLLNVLGADYGAIVRYSTANTFGILVTTYPWVMAGKRFGKRRCYLFAIGVLALQYASWSLLAAPPSTTALAIRGVVSGAAATGMVIFSLSMLTDTMEFDSRRNAGARREGVIASFFAVVEKVGFAIGPSISGVVIAWAGYRPTIEGKIIPQAHSAIMALYVVTCFLPGLLLIVSGIMVWRYDLDEARLRSLTEGTEP